MGIDWIFFTHHKRFVDDVCTYGSFENIYAGLQLFMVDVRTNLFATPSLRVGTMLGSERYDGDILNFFHTSHTFRRWCMYMWKLRKYLRGSTIIHGRHTHQSVRNAKSTRGYDAGKDQRGMMGMDWIFFTSQTFFWWCMHTWKLWKYLRGCTVFLVAIRTNLFATPSLRMGTCVLMLRVSEARWE